MIWDKEVLKGVNGMIYERMKSWDISWNIKDVGKLLVKT